MIKTEELRELAVSLLEGKQYKRPKNSRTEITEKDIDCEVCRLTKKVVLQKIKSQFDPDNSEHMLCYAIIDQAIEDLMSLQVFRRASFKNDRQKSTWYARRIIDSRDALKFLIRPNILAEMCNVNSAFIPNVIRSYGLHTLTVDEIEMDGLI